MKKPVCIVSTYLPQHCGIATYTAELAHALANAGSPVTVLSERGAHIGSVDGVMSRPIWDRRENWVPQILDAVKSLNPRVVHIQHTADSLGWDTRLPSLLEGLKQHGIPSVVTLHTVHDLWSGLMELKILPSCQHRRIARLSSAVVVHGTASQAEELVRQGLPSDKIIVIPHGTKILPCPDPSESRALLGIGSDGPLLLCFGFIHVLKNLHTIIRAMSRLSRQMPEVRLLLAGSIQNRACYNRLYLWNCRRMIRKIGKHSKVELRDEFIDSERLPSLYAAADIVLLPYSQRYGSASGIAHSAIGAGKMILCSESPKFAEIGASVSKDLIVPTYDPDAWADRIKRLLKDDEYRNELKARILLYAEKTAWQKIAQEHISLYSKLET